MTKLASMPFPTELLERLNLGIQIEGQTPAQNHYSTCLDLLRRASELDEAIRALSLPYTYQIIDAPPEKQKARQMLGMASVEMLTNLRNELVAAAFEEFISYDALTKGVYSARLASRVESMSAREGETHTEAQASPGETGQT